VNYTDAQRKAITTIDRNLQIVACAGSGKTQVVAERVAEILEADLMPQAQPRNIVAFTFTERAAGELKARIIERVHARLGPIPGLAELYVGTIHGYCLQLLQTHLPHYFKYSVLNEVQTRLLVDRASRKAGMQTLRLSRWIESRLYLDVLNVLREADIDWSALRQHPALESLQIYREYLDEKRYFDYTEIMSRAVEAVQTNENVRAELAERLQYLIVDEYQDVNPLQETLVSELHALGANVCVVGDDDQTIYQWRGSSVEGILGFASRYPPVRTVPIELNFRSSLGVVESARKVIEFNDPDRLRKSMQSAESQPFERGDILCLRFDSAEDEAAWIARKAKALIGAPFVDRPGGPPRGLAQSDIAILLRSVKRNGGAIVAALRAEGLEVVVAGMTGLFDRPEVQAAVGIFQFMDRRISRGDLHGLWRRADVGIEQAGLDAALDALEQGREWDPSVRFSVYNLQRSYLNFLETVSLREDLIPLGRGEVVYYNLGKFSEVISDYEQIHFYSDPKEKYRSFVEFLERQAPDYYPEGWQDGGVCTAECRARDDSASSKGYRVAGRFRTVPDQESLSVQEAGWKGKMACHSAHGSTKRRQV
jgi:DNA helicase II / ATP-dependent DNA helicase PcrA